MFGAARPIAATDLWEIPTKRKASVRKEGKANFRRPWLSSAFHGFEDSHKTNNPSSSRFGSFVVDLSIRRSCGTHITSPERDAIPADAVGGRDDSLGLNIKIDFKP